MRVLGDEEDEREVVKTQSEVEELVRIAQEDDVLDGLLGSLGVPGCCTKGQRRGCSGGQCECIPLRSTSTLRADS